MYYYNSRKTNITIECIACILSVYVSIPFEMSTKTLAINYKKNN